LNGDWTLGLSHAANGSASERRLPQDAETNWAAANHVFERVAEGRIAAFMTGTSPFLRGLPLSTSQSQGDLTNASVPSETPLPAGWQEPSKAFMQLVEWPPVMTTRLRLTCWGRPGPDGRGWRATLAELQAAIVG
jgi:hypothetical protein